MPTPNDLSASEAADVLRRAAMLQARSASEPGVGLSIEELKHAAEAAGIDGRYVEQAYLGGGEPRAESPPFLGIETGVQRTRVVRGHVSDAEWGRMVLALRREFGTDGEAETLGEARAWKAYQTRIELEQDGPNTRMTATGSWESDAKVPLYASVFYVVLAALIAVGAAVSGEPAAWGLTGLLAVMTLLHIGFVWGPVRKRAATRGPQLDRALDVLSRLAVSDEHADAAPALPGATPERSPRLDPSLLDDPTPSDAPHVHAGRGRQREQHPRRTE